MEDARMNEIIEAYVAYCDKRFWEEVDAGFVDDARYWSCYRDGVHGLAKAIKDGLVKV